MSVHPELFQLDETTLTVSGPAFISSACLLFYRGENISRGKSHLTFLSHKVSQYLSLIPVPCCSTLSVFAGRKMQDLQASELSCVERGPPRCKGTGRTSEAVNICYMV